MSDSWGSSGERLVVKDLMMLIESERSSDTAVVDDPFFATGCSTGPPVFQPTPPDPTYVSLKGQQTFCVTAGGWTMEFRLNDSASYSKGKATTLQLWLDLDKAGCGRNDVSLEGGVRLYGTAHCWREQDYETGRRSVVERSHIKLNLDEDIMVTKELSIYLYMKYFL